MIPDCFIVVMLGSTMLNLDATAFTSEDDAIQSVRTSYSHTKADLRFSKTVDTTDIIMHNTTIGKIIKSPLYDKPTHL